MDGTGTQYNLGQDLRPGLAGQTFTVSAFKREIEINGPGMRTTQTRTPNFAYFQGPQAQTQVQGVDGEVAYNVGANGTPARASAAVAADRRAEQYHHPLRLLRVALAADAQDLAGQDRGARAADRGDDRRWTDHAGGRRRRQADAHPVARLAHQPGRRGTDDHARRLRRCRRAAIADPAGHPGGRLHDRHLPGEEHRRGHRRGGRPGRGAQRPAAGGAGRQRRGRGSRAGRVVPRRPVAPQRGRRLQGPPGADRSAAERGPHAGGDRQGARAAARAPRSPTW